MDLVNELEARKVHFQSITDSVDTKTPAGRFFFHIMSALSQMERELILERTRARLEVARCAGRVGGRKRRMTDGKVQAARKLLASGDAAQRGGGQLRRVGSHTISVGSGLLTEVRARARAFASATANTIDIPSKRSILLLPFFGRMYLDLARY